MLVVVIYWFYPIEALWEHLLSGYRGRRIFLFFKMVVVLVKEIKLIVVMDDLDFRIKNVTFGAKVLNRYGTFD
jgi:hypothetical protein